jgi:hypothetical protein
MEEPVRAAQRRPRQYTEAQLLANRDRERDRRVSRTVEQRVEEQFKDADQRQAALPRTPAEVVQRKKVEKKRKRKPMDFLQREAHRLDCEWRRSQRTAGQRSVDAKRRKKLLQQKVERKKLDSMVAYLRRQEAAAAAVGSAGGEASSGKPAIQAKKSTPARPAPTLSPEELEQLETLRANKKALFEGMVRLKDQEANEVLARMQQLIPDGWTAHIVPVTGEMLRTTATWDFRFIKNDTGDDLWYGEEPDQWDLPARDE